MILIQNKCIVTHVLAAQCIISTPDKSVLNGSDMFSEIQQVQNINTTGKKDYPDVCINLTGNSIVFDSFSPKELVSSLNSNINTVSQAKYTSKRFPTDFSVNVKGHVTAILSDASVGDYMVVDKLNHRVVTAQTRRNFGKKTTATAPSSQDDTSTFTANASSVSPCSDDVATLSQPEKRQLDSPVVNDPPPKRARMEPPMMMQAPVNRFSMHTQRYVSFMQQPFRQVNAPPIPTTIFRPSVTLRPTVVLEKPNYARVNAKPLFAPSDEDEPNTPRTAKTPPLKSTLPLFTSTPSPPDHDKRPHATPSSFLSPGTRYSSDDFIVMGRSVRNSSSEVNNVCVVSTKDMLTMDLPRLNFRMSSQDEISIPTIRIPSREVPAQVVRIGSELRIPSQDEIIAIHALARMRS